VGRILTAVLGFVGAISRLVVTVGRLVVMVILTLSNVVVVLGVTISLDTHLTAIAIFVFLASTLALKLEEFRVKLVFVKLIWKHGYHNPRGK